jgi:glycosyltransferase involved in cell wall biosynthesis
MVRIKMRIVFDDVFLSWANSGVARYWRSILEEWSREYETTYKELDVVILDRSGKLRNLGFVTVPFASRLWDSKSPALDRDLVSRACVSLHADVFISSYYGFSLDTPSLVTVYDLIPEQMGFENHDGPALERQLAIVAGDGHVAISASTKADLLLWNDHLRVDDISIAKPGLDLSIFYPRSQEEIAKFRSTHNLVGEYVVLPGTRFGGRDYKNGSLVFSLIESGLLGNIILVATGGEPLTQTEMSTCRAAGIPILRVVLEDDDLATCFSGASVVLYPSLYEGFGLPPLEALATGTPTITTMTSSLPESVGKLSLPISGTDIVELQTQITVARSEAWAKKILVEGPAWASNFLWSQAANEIFHSAKRLMKTTPRLHREVSWKQSLADYNRLAIVQQR